MIVVDASVAVKWLIEEQGSISADRLLADHPNELTAPDLLLIEVAGALVRRRNARTMPDQAFDAALNEWRHLSDAFITVRRVNATDMADAARVAVELGHPIKDCVYLTLAMQLDAPLITADAKFRARALRLHPRIDLLDTPQ